MLDPTTLRVTLGFVSLTVLALFYVGVYRPTRSPFSGWWTWALLCSGLASSLLLFNGSDLQGVANPLSTAISAAGATLVWFATRSLRPVRIPVIALLIGPPAVAAVAFADHPATNIWAGNGILFTYMGCAFAVAATEVWVAWRRRQRIPASDVEGQALTALAVSGIAATVLAVFYLGRAVLYFVVGHDGEFFARAGGSGTATVILIVCLVAVTFSVSTIGWDQRARELHARAIQDDLTGLLGRAEFLDRAEHACASAIEETWLAIADLDHFKAINDEHGHAAGDRALVSYARAILTEMGERDIAGRLGGEEFGMVLCGATADEAVARMNAIDRAFAAETAGDVTDTPTVSYGLARATSAPSMTALLKEADEALYSAKREGRDRVAISGSEPIA